MRVLILTVHVPFVRGGAEVLAEGLRDAILTAGHRAEIVGVPFNAFSAETIAEQILACRLLDVTSFVHEPIDRVIGLKFPAYLMRHPDKVLWVLHQHRSAYDLWEEPWGDLIQAPNGAALREIIHQADQNLLPEARAIYTISQAVSQRLREANGIDSTPLYPPVPGGERFSRGRAANYFLFPSRISTAKRQTLVLEALARTRQHVHIRFIGRPDSGSELLQFQDTIRRLGLAERVDWQGEVSEDQKLQLYAHALGVIFPPLMEDYGFVTAEAMLSSKPVITSCDSGGPLELVRDRETGLVVEPTPDALADAMDGLWADRKRAARMGRRGREAYDAMEITWPLVAERLLA